MSETWFTSDLHLGHKNILEFEPEARPFANLEQMHHELIKRHNMVVGKYDKVYMVGDVCWNKKYLPLLDEMNGEKRLILGNHDQFKMEAYLPYFEKIYGMKYWERAVITHAPIHPGSLSHRFFINVHGHLHSSVVTNDVFLGMSETGGVKYSCRPDNQYFNVSVEQNGLVPIHESMIRKRWEEVEDS